MPRVSQKMLRGYAAKALGLEMPSELISIADEVIE
jgi:hypothetical protein